jgi:hypothetical protein
MRANSAAAIGAALFASAWLTATAHAQTLLERSAEVRMQLDLAVSPAALKALLPDGWEPFVATSGPAKDCNVRLIFVDRVGINGPDGAPRGTEQMAYFASPIKKAGRNVMDGQMVIDGITANANNAPGPLSIRLRPAIALSARPMPLVADRSKTRTPGSSPAATASTWRCT